MTIAVVILSLISLVLGVALVWLKKKIDTLRYLLSEQGQKTAAEWRAIAMHHCKKAKGLPALEKEYAEMHHAFMTFAVAAFGTSIGDVESADSEELKRRLGERKVTRGEMLTWIKAMRRRFATEGEEVKKSTFD